MVDAGKKMAEERLETEKQRQAMEAAASLRASRQAMEAAETPEQLREIACRRSLAAKIPARLSGRNTATRYLKQIVPIRQKLRQ